MEFRIVASLLFNLLGGLGIFLLGMKNMSEGMQAVAGSGLRKIISIATDNRFLAIGIGIIVTCLVQSSSVTTVMVVGLVNSGVMMLNQAIGVIFGANIGTTITGWILTLKIGKYGLPILGVSAFFFLFSKNDRIRYTAMAIMGIGMVFFGLELMKNGLKPVQQLPEFKAWFAAFQADSYFGVLKCASVGCILTVIVQSSSATLGITMALAATGIIGFETAAALVLGENIGTTITALLASIGAATNARRAAYSHALFNLISVAWITAIFPFYLHLIHSVVGHDPGLSVIKDGMETFPHILAGIALVHTGFNIANTILFIPLLGPLAAIVTKLVPEKKGKEIRHLTYLDVRMLDTPSIGIAQSRQEVNFMGQSVLKMLGFLETIIKNKTIDEDMRKKLFHREEILDTTQKEITVFLSQLISGSVTHDVITEVRKQIRMADEYESISDYIANVLKMLIKLERNEIEISTKGREEMLALHKKVAQYLHMITQAGEQDSVSALMPRAITMNGEITHLMKDFRRNHLDRLEKDKLPPLKTLVYTDILNAYRRMSDHGQNVAEALCGEK